MQSEYSIKYYLCRTKTIEITGSPSFTTDKILLGQSNSTTVRDSGIKITTSVGEDDTTVPTSKAVKTYVNSIEDALEENINTKLSKVYTVKGSVEDYKDLPKNNAIGDVYNVRNAHGNIPAGTNWVWVDKKDGALIWDPLGGTVDLEPYAKSEDKANTLVEDDNSNNNTILVGNMANTREIKVSNKSIVDEINDEDDSSERITKVPTNQAIVTYVSEKIAEVSSGEIELSGYATETYVATAIGKKQDTLTAGQNIKMTKSDNTTTIDTKVDLDTLASKNELSAATKNIVKTEKDSTTLTSGKLVLGAGSKLIKESSFEVSDDTLSDSHTTIPTSNVVKTALDNKLNKIVADSTPLLNNNILIGTETTVKDTGIKIINSGNTLDDTSTNIPTSNVIKEYITSLDYATKDYADGKENPLEFGNEFNRNNDKINLKLNGSNTLATASSLSLKVSLDSNNNLRVTPEVATTAKFGLIKSGSGTTGELPVVINSNGVGYVDAYKKADTYSKTEINNKLANVYTVKGSVDNYNDLPKNAANNTVGDVYNVRNAHGNIPAGTNYVWIESTTKGEALWDPLGGIVDLSNYIVYDATANSSDTVIIGTTDKKVKASSTKLSDLATKTEVDDKQDNITVGTSSQYYRGDKTWQTLNKAAVGLGNVDNTTDINKPISNATQTALNGKLNTAGGTISGELIVSGATTLSSTLNVTGATDLNNTLTFNNSGYTAINTLGKNINIGKGSIEFSSDERLKDIHEDLTLETPNWITDTIKNTHIYNYNFKGQENKKIGLIAQRLEENVTPELKEFFVHTGPEGELEDKKSIDPNALIFLLWAEVQRLQQVVGVLQEKVK